MAGRAGRKSAGNQKWVNSRVKNLNSKAEIERTAQAILDARQKYTGASFAELYGEKMYLFTDLVAAHASNDAAVLKAYGWPTDLSEPEIVSRLFDMYAKLTAVDSSRKVKDS